MKMILDWQERGKKMANIKIVTDSSSTMETEFIKKLDIHVIPLSIMLDGVIYSDNDELDKEKFMEMMSTAKALPKTSQPPIGEFAELYDKLGADGSSVISIHMTESLSGTVNAARQAAQLTKTDVTVIDCTFTDQSQSFIVIRAAELAQQGASKEEILKEIEQIISKSKLFIGISNLDNLVKGGRVSRVAGMLSNIFNMKVVMELKNSELVVQTKGRGTKAFTKWFEECKKELQTLKVKQIGISHADGLEIAQYFKDSLQQMFPDMHIPILHTGPIIATHAGKGAFAVMFYTE